MIINNKYIVIMLCLCFWSCTKLQEEKINKVKILGHGGMGINNSYPLNSYESIISAINLGADGVEIDVQLTKDGELIAFHDESLATNNNLKKVYDYTYSELVNYKISNYPFTYFQLTHIDTLLQAIKNVEQFIFTFDCKTYAYLSDGYMDSFANAILKISHKYAFNHPIMIESFEIPFIKKMKEYDLPVYYYAHAFDEGLKIAKQMNLEGITISNELIEMSHVNQAHDANIKVATFNLHNNHENVNAINKGVDYLQTDVLKSILKKK